MQSPVPMFVHSLTALSKILDKAEAFAEALHQRRDGAHELRADQFGFVHARIFFGKTVVGLCQKA